MSVRSFSVRSSASNVSTTRKEKTPLAGKPGFRPSSASSTSRPVVKTNNFSSFMNANMRSLQPKIECSDHSLVVNENATGKIDVKLNREVILDTLQDLVNIKMDGFQHETLEKKVEALYEDQTSTSNVMAESMDQLQKNFDELHSNYQELFNNVKKLSENVVLQQSNDDSHVNTNVVDVLKSMNLSEEDVLRIIKKNTLSEQKIENIVNEHILDENKIQSMIENVQLNENERDVVKTLTQKMEFLNTLPDNSAGLFHGDMLLFSRGENGNEAKFTGFCLQDLVNHVNSENQERFDELVIQNEALTNQVQSLTEQVNYLKNNTILKPPTQKIATHVPSHVVANYKKVSKVAPTGTTPQILDDF